MLRVPFAIAERQVLLEAIPQDLATHEVDDLRSGVGRYKRAAVAGGLTASIPMLLALWNYGFHPLRTTHSTGVLSNVFDLQARAMMAGHLSVPRGSLGIEGYVVGRHEYTYFGLFPAILRMPVLAVTHALDGRLTAPSMLVAWIVLVTFTSLLLWRVRIMVRGDSPLARVEATGHAILIAAVGSGSIVLSLVALPWVYEEAQLWGVATAVGALFAIVGVLERPSTWRIVAAGCLTAAAVLSRVPNGWGCCLALAAIALFVLVRTRGRDVRVGGCVLAAAAVPFLIGVAVNYAKFRVPFTIPFDAQVWTSLNLHRRQALAANGGSLFGPQFLPSTLIAYLRPDGIRFTSILPFISVPAKPAATYGGAFLDVTYRTGSATSFMPLLFLLGAWGVVVAFGRRGGRAVASFRLPIVGAAVMTGGVLASGYIATRYASDFVPVLVMASVIGIVDLARRSSSWSRLRQLAGLTALVTLAGFQVVANLAVATTTSAQVSAGPLMRSLVSTEERVSGWSGDPLSGYVEQGSTLPDYSTPDHLRVIGDCHAVYMGTGDRSQPWVPVDVRSLSMEVTVLASGPPGTLRLATFTGYIDQSLELERNSEGLYRFVVDGSKLLGTVTTMSSWQQIPIGTRVHLRVSADVNNMRFAVYSPSMISANVSMVDWAINHKDGRSGATPYVLDVGPPTLEQQSAFGINVSASYDRPSKLCQGLR